MKMLSVQILRWVAEGSCYREIDKVINANFDGFSAPTGQARETHLNCFITAVFNHREIREIETGTNHASNQSITMKRSIYCARVFMFYGYCQAAKKANNTFAAFPAARFMKVLISFSPSPPPARSLRERKAMNGTPLL